MAVEPCFKKLAHHDQLLRGGSEDLLLLGRVGHIPGSVAAHSSLGRSPCAAAIRNRRPKR